MNREIEFRLRIDNKIVGYERWYGGKKMSDGDPTGARPCWLYSKDGKHWDPDYIYHNQKDQSTGLKDENEKEIYEGDIISHIGYDEQSKIEFIDGGFWPTNFDNENGWPELIEVEVIGNIYENSELLK